jgi:CHAD domain-containing protein
VAYELGRDETLSAGVRRVALEQLDGAIESLRGSGDRNEAIHDARKRCKKLRAVLRLVRDGLGAEAYRDQNAGFRDVARRLGSARDRWVLVETVDALQARYGAFLADAALGPLRQRFVARHRAALQRLQADRADEEAASALEGLRAAVLAWRLDDDDPSIVAAGVRRVYRRGRRAMARAAERPSSETFHEWRKQAKYLWYHARLLRAHGGVGMAPTSGLEGLARQLGEEHDLAVLGEGLRVERRLTGGVEHRGLLLGLIERRGQELREEALADGRRFYARKPREVVARLARQWSRSHAGAPAVDSGSGAGEPPAADSEAAQGSHLARPDAARARQG